MSTFYLALYQGIIAANNELKTANQKVINAAGQIQGASVNVTQMNAALTRRQIDASNAQYNIDTIRSKPALPIPVVGQYLKTLEIQNAQSDLNAANSDVKHYNEVLASVKAFEHATNGVYALAQQLFEQVAKGESQIRHAKFSAASGYVFPVSTPAWLGQLSSLEAKALKRENAEAMAALKTPTGAYNWTTIRKWLQDNLDDLTPAQIQALAQTYLGMSDTKDIEKFIGCGYSIYDPIVDTPAGSYASSPELRLSATFKVVAAAVEQAVTPLAMATVWAGSNPLLPYNSDVVNSDIAHMEILQIVVANGSDIRSADLQEFEPGDRATRTLNTTSTVSPFLISHTDPKNPNSPLQISMTTGFVATVSKGTFDCMFTGKPTVLGSNNVTDLTGMVDAHNLLDSEYGSLTNRYIGGVDTAGAITDTVIGQVRGQLIAALVPAAIATPVGMAASAVISIVTDVADYDARLNTAGVLFRQEQVANTADALKATVCYTDINGTSVINGIQNNTTSALIDINGYLKTSGSDLTSNQLLQIAYNGAKGPGYTPLSPAAIGNLTEQQQLKVYSAFSDFTDSSSVAKNSYVKSLNTFYRSSSVQTLIQKEYGVKYPGLGEIGIADPNMPPEVAQAVITAYNNKSN